MNSDRYVVIERSDALFLFGLLTSNGEIGIAFNMGVPGEDNLQPMFIPWHFVLSVETYTDLGKFRHRVAPFRGTK